MFRTILSIFIFISSIVIANPPEFIQNCADCHGEKGISTESDIPIIAGASATFFEETFYSYKNDLRPAIQSKYRLGDTSREASDMKKIVEQLSEQQMIEVAQYFSEQPFIAAKQNFDSAQAKIGARIHAKKCNKCHEDGGSSAADDAGILAGQWTPYLSDAMKNIVDDTRDTNDKMKKQIKKLKDKEWQALLHYYASQQD